MSLKTLFAAAVLALAPFTASAVTIMGSFLDGSDTDINPPMGIIGATSIITGDDMMEELTFSFTNIGSQAAIIGITGDINRSGHFTNLSLDLDGSGPSISNVGANSFDFTLSTLVLPSETSVFTLAYDSASMFGQANFDVSVAAVPLPAAGWMLLSAVAGIGFLSRKRRSVA